MTCASSSVVDVARGRRFLDHLGLCVEAAEQRKTTAHIRHRLRCLMWRACPFRNALMIFRRRSGIKTDSYNNNGGTLPRAPCSIRLRRPIKADFGNERYTHVSPGSRFSARQSSGFSRSTMHFVVLTHPLRINPRSLKDRLPFFERRRRSPARWLNAAMQLDKRSPTSRRQRLHPAETDEGAYRQEKALLWRRPHQDRRLHNHRSKLIPCPMRQEPVSPFPFNPRRIPSYRRKIPSSGSRDMCVNSMKPQGMRPPRQPYDLNAGSNSQYFSQFRGNHYSGDRLRQDCVRHQ